MIVVGLITLGLALLPALMILRNVAVFAPPEEVPGGTLARAGGAPHVSILIPARNEAASIAECVRGALHSEGVQVEVVVLDDDSSDATADIVAAIAGRDSRVRLVRGGPLPAGWNGKQHACWRLSLEATHDWMMFLDADVRLHPQAASRLVAAMQGGGVTGDKVALLSVFPHQETKTFWERLLIPMMHVILLGYLPIDRMRSRTDPSLAAGCGQLFLTDRDSYERSGGHAAIRDSRHDGIMLPRAFRRAGMMSDVCDGTPLARCRMYHGGGEVMRGLLKNADEGIANPRLIVPFSVLLLGSAVAPWVLLPWAVAAGATPAATWVLALALVAGWLPRWVCAWRFQQSRVGALLHPLAVAVFVGLQWVALVNHLSGRRIAWRGRGGT